MLPRSKKINDKMKNHCTGGDRQGFDEIWGMHHHITLGGFYDDSQEIKETRQEGPVMPYEEKGIPTRRPNVVQDIGVF